MCIEKGQFNVDMKIVISQLDDMDSKRASIKEMLSQEHMFLDAKLIEMLDWLGTDIRLIKRRLTLMLEEG